MTAPVDTSESGFGGQNWANIISGVGQGAQSALGGMSANANSRKEAREAKRRTLADLLNRAMKRDMAMYRTGQDYADEGADYQSQALQQVAKGFVSALNGSSLGGR